MNQFLWTPGDGVDPAALERLRTHFRRPSDPMGEAWFMGDVRKMYPELLGDLGEVSTYDLKKPLIEIASGTGSFGPTGEWNTWYHYLLGALLPRGHEAHVSYLLESLLTGFMAIYPNGVYREPYKGFHEDALLTLGRSIMDSECWNGSDIAIGKVLRRSNNNPNQVWVWWNASGDLSASLFFCMKYLPDVAVEPWLRSVLDIPSPHWRAQVMVWFVGAHELLNSAVRWPSEFAVQAHPRHRLGMVALPAARTGYHGRQRRAAGGSFHRGRGSSYRAQGDEVLLHRGQVSRMARRHLVRSLPGSRIG